MSDEQKAPVRIWANSAVFGNGKPLAGEWNHCDVGSPDDTEYVRADIADDLLAALEALRSVIPGAMVALMTLGRNGLLMADVLHKKDDAARAAIAKAKEQP